MRYLTIAVLLLTVVSCGDDYSEGFGATPLGYSVRFTDQGTIATGRATLNDIHLRLEGELAGLTDPALRNAATHVAFDIVDNHSFLVGNAWAAGQWLPQANTVKVCLYGQGVGPVAPSDAPTWTVRQSWRDPALMVWGVVPAYLPALGHELGHAAYGPAAGH